MRLGEYWGETCYRKERDTQKTHYLMDLLSIRYSLRPIHVERCFFQAVMIKYPNSGGGSIYTCKAGIYFRWIPDLRVWEREYAALKTGCFGGRIKIVFHIPWEEKY